MATHKSTAWIASISLLVLVGALGAPGLRAAEDKAQEDEKEGAYVEFSKEQPRGEAHPDQALVYVVRPTSVGFAIKSWFLVDDQSVGINKGDSYFFAHVAPGKHVFWSKSENVDALELEVAGGETYYIQQHVRMGGFKARTKLEVLDEAAGQAALAKCGKHATMTERGRTRGAEIAREYKANTEEDLERRAKEAAEKKAGE